VRAAADHVDPAGGGLGQHVVGGVGAVQQADLQRDPLAHLLAQRDQRVDAAERVALGGEIDVRPHRGDAARGVAVQRSATPRVHVRGVDHGPVRAPLLDRRHQVVVPGRPQPGRRQRLVQVGVRLAAGRQRLPSGGVEISALPGVGHVGDDHPVPHGKITDRAVDPAYAAQHRHRRAREAGGGPRTSESSNRHVSPGKY
jgi:hypothetical protein